MYISQQQPLGDVLASAIRAHIPVAYGSPTVWALCADDDLISLSAGTIVGLEVVAA